MKALLAHGANPNAPITKGTPVRRNSEDFELPATLIGATPYLLAAKFLEADIMRALAGGRRRSAAADEDRRDAADGRGRRGRERSRRIVAGSACSTAARSRTNAASSRPSAAAIAHGGDVNAVNQAGDTALHGAAPLGYDRVIEQLVRAGARLDVRNARGLTALGQLEGKVGAGLRSPDRVNRGPRETTVELLRSLGTQVASAVRRTSGCTRQERYATVLVDPVGPGADETGPQQRGPRRPGHERNAPGPPGRRTAAELHPHRGDQQGQTDRDRKRPAPDETENSAADAAKGDHIPVT